MVIFTRSIGTPLVELTASALIFVVDVLLAVGAP